MSETIIAQQQEEKKIDVRMCLHQPIWSELANSKKVLIAGCGGGYDFLSGIPVFFALKEVGLEVYLANLTFTNLMQSTCEKLTEYCTVVTHESTGHPIRNYWPELQLSKWLFDTKGINLPIYMLSRTGVKPLKEAYQKIIERHSIDTVILTDGGTDSLMKGDEAGLGTPEEDMLSIAAVNGLDNAIIKAKVLMCTALGVDCFHGVAHSLFFENVSELDRDGYFLGSFSLCQSMNEVKAFIDAFESCTPDQSIVCCQLRDAIQGHFGNHHSNPRTRGSKLFISPLMSQVWCFKLEGVAKHNLYLNEITNTRTFAEIPCIIRSFQDSLPENKIRIPQQIPY